MNMKKLTILSAVLFTAAFTGASHAQTTTAIVDHNVAVDGTTDSDITYFASSTGSALEDDVSNSIGLVSGTSSRQIHAIFATQTLDVGDTLTGVFTFTTPRTTASDAGNGDDFRIGFFDHLGRGDSGGPLLSDTTYSSGSPNADWSGLPGYALELDVENAARTTQLAEADIAHRRSDPSTSGRNLGTTTGLSNLTNGPDIGYFFDPETEYTVEMTFEHLVDGSIQVTSSLVEDTTPQGSAFSSVDASPLSYSFGLIGFNASSNAFGSTTSQGLVDDEMSQFFGLPQDNGIEITNVTISYFDADGVVDGGGDDTSDGEACFVIPTSSGGTAVVCL